MELEIKKISSDVVLGSFDCGNQSINNLISQSYYPTLLHQGHAFCVHYNGQVIAYYMLSIIAFNIDKCPPDVKEYLEHSIKNSFNKHFAAVHIQYLAVDKQYQKYGIGTQLLKRIIKSTQALCKQWPIRFITLDALDDKVPWYRKNGFKEFGFGDTDHATTMYLDCVSQKDIDDYASDV